jgi:cysteinyl-tRNA synthetase
MSLKLYNTMTGKKELFVPLREGRVSMYACGVTVYDFSHIGHARAMVVFDVIQRYFAWLGYAVTFVRNYTDIDDKIIRRANEEGVPYSAVSERFIGEFDADMHALGVEAPTHAPKATAHIADMIDLIATLERKGHAYAVDGDVFFAVASFPEYGKLSGKNIDNLLSGARIEVDPRKQNPLDFVLWKKSKPGEPWWESPWGKGRPGWHIECSAMSRKYLGDSFDIHGGGMDLMFPHHENEIAQAECATGAVFARYWLHNGFVNINKEKMSKSLKNFMTIREVLQYHHPETIRLFLLSHHYRSPVDYSPQNLAEAQAGLDRFYALLQDMQQAACGADTTDTDQQSALAELQAFPEKFRAAMDDDFNTAAAIGHLHVLTRMLNGITDRAKKDAGCPVSRKVVEAARAVFSDAGAVLGLFRERPAAYFEARKKEGLEGCGITEPEIEALIAQRLEAKKQKDWSRADAIRDRLAGHGILLKDTPRGTGWSVQS